VTASVKLSPAAVATSTSVAAPSVRRFETRLRESSAARTATIGFASNSMRRRIAVSLDWRRAAPLAATSNATSPSSAWSIGRPSIIACAANTKARDCLARTRVRLFARSMTRSYAVMIVIFSGAVASVVIKLPPS
jgi:hypothetical protein